MGLFKNISSNSLLQSGLGILANNTGHYGQFAPAFGRGTQQGLQNVQRFNNQNQLQGFRKQQMGMQQARFKQQQNEMTRQQGQREAQTKAFADIAAQRNIDPNLLTAFPAVGKDLVRSNLIPKSTKIGFTPNGVSYDENNPSTLEVGKSYAKPESKPTPVQEYEYAVGQGFEGNIFDYQKQKARAGASTTSVTYGAPVSGLDAGGNPVFFQPSKDGSAPSIIDGVTPQPKPKKAATESQAKAATFYSQMTNASKTLESIEGYDPESMGDQVGTAFASGAGNLVVSPANQQARQAQNQWAESFLRIKTGAAATKQEVENNVQTFFPQAGDSPAVIEQKVAARKQAESDVLHMTQDPNQVLMRGAEMPKGQPLTEMPPPNKYKGRVIVDQETGTQYQSNGLQWKEMK